MSQYDKFEKIFGGKWQYDRDENMTTFMDYCGKAFIQLFVSSFARSLSHSLVCSFIRLFVH